MSRVLFCGSCWAMQKRLEGGESRPRASWVVQGKWLQSGVGRCFIAGRYTSTAWNVTAFAYFIVWGDWAYYGFSKTEEQNAHHALMWHAIKTLKASGVRWLELGWQGEAQTAKGKDIEFFKRGWGGRDVPVVMSGCAERIDRWTA